MTRIVITREHERPQATASKPKTRAQKRKASRVKKKRWRDRHYGLGLQRMEVWVHPDDVQAVREFGHSLLQARGISLDAAEG